MAPSEVHGKGFYDATLSANLIPVGAGEHGVTKSEKEMFTTTLGSCISACLRDPEARIGGMNHIMLPGDTSSSRTNDSNSPMLFGDHAMEVLLNDILRNGGVKARLEAKIFGGANVMKSSDARSIGDNNFAFVKHFLTKERIQIVAQDVGGNCARRIIFSPFSGRVLVNALAPNMTSSLARSEVSHRERITKPRPSSNIEIFR